MEWSHHLLAAGADREINTSPWRPYEIWVNALQKLAHIPQNRRTHRREKCNHGYGDFCSMDARGGNEFFVTHRVHFALA
jgi:hypothetical protein